MSPEQALGNWHKADERADIYALGVIYFELLTNEPPFRGNYRMLLNQIKNADPPSPRSLNHRLPKDIETIVLKCLEKEPDRRYQTAEELSSELDRVLSGEPILARPISRLERGIRWCRRRPALVSWIGGLSSLIVLVTVIAFVLITLSRNAERDAKEEAIVMAREARNALDVSTSNVNEQLKHYGVTQALRMQLLRKAVNDYEEFTRHTSDDPRLEMERARAWLRLGDLHRQLNDTESARAAYVKAKEISAAEHVKWTESQRGVITGLALTRLGSLDAESGQLAEAESQFTLASRQWEQILNADTDNDEAIEGLIATLLNHGMLKLRVDELDEAERILAEAASLGKQAESITDPLALHWKNVAEVHSALGELHLHLGEPKRATDHFRQAVKHFQRHHEQFKVDNESVESLAATRIRLAGAYRAMGDFTKERDAYLQAINDYENLNQLLPGVPLFRESLALTRTDLGQWLHEQGQTARARETLELALAEFSSLASDHPSNPRYFEELATCCDVLGQVLSIQGERTEAEQFFRKAVESFAELHRLVPAESGYAERMAICRSHLAQVLGKQGRNAEAVEEFEASRKTLLELSKQAPEVVSYRTGLAHVLMHFGDLHSRREQSDEAAEKYTQAISLWQGVVDASQSPQSLNDLAWFLSTCMHEDVRDPSRAGELALRAAALSPSNPFYLETVAMTQFRSGAYQQCLEKLDQAAEYRENAHGQELLIRAMAQAKLEQLPRATESLKLAEDWIEANAPDDQSMSRLYREAERLLASPAE